MLSCLFVNHIHPTNNAYISPIEKWDLDGTYNGLASDLHRTCIGTAKKVYGIMEKLRIGKKKW